VDTKVDILIAIIGIGIGNIAIMVSLFLWMRSEANTDRRDIQNTQKEDRKDLLQLNRNIEKAIEAIQIEIRDFHTRLCSLEERKVK